jgi:hypothetical protein
MCLIHSIGGAFTQQPEELDRKLTAKSSDLIKRAFADIDSQKLIDHHVHIAGLGVGGTNTFVNPKRHNFDLFLRLMDEKRYEGLVFGEISAMTQFNRIGKPLQTILEREDLHERLVNGSDYPLPAVNILIRTRPLVKQGYLTDSEGACLKEIYDYNPLLFDFVLKRTLKHPQTSRTLPASIFMSNPSLSV